MKAGCGKQSTYHPSLILPYLARPNIPPQKLVLQTGSALQPLVLACLPRATQPSLAPLGEVAARDARRLAGTERRGHFIGQQAHLGVLGCDEHAQLKHVHL